MLRRRLCGSKGALPSAAGLLYRALSYNPAKARTEKGPNYLAEQVRVAVLPPFEDKATSPFSGNRFPEGVKKCSQMMARLKM